jgi:hypothetical protein
MTDPQEKPVYETLESYVTRASESTKSPCWRVAKPFVYLALAGAALAAAYFVERAVTHAWVKEYENEKK